MSNVFGCAYVHVCDLCVCLFDCWPTCLYVGVCVCFVFGFCVNRGGMHSRVSVTAYLDREGTRHGQEQGDEHQGVGQNLYMYVCVFLCACVSSCACVSFCAWKCSGMSVYVSVRMCACYRVGHGSGPALPVTNRRARL